MRDLGGMTWPPATGQRPQVGLHVSRARPLPTGQHSGQERGSPPCSTPELGIQRHRRSHDGMKAMIMVLPDRGKVRDYSAS